jgi:peptide/nickel transport system substrate-binding protein
MLTRLVNAGKLPPLEQRLPKDPLVVKPYEAPGYYGGTWRMMVDSPDLGVYKMIAGYAPLVRWKADCSGLEPGTASAWKYNADGTQLTLHLRHGIKWSDGVEFTSEDFLYWATLCHEGKQQKLATPFWSRVNGKEMTVTAPDKYTIVMRFAGPNWYVPLQLATGFWWSEQYNAPKHYLRRFDPNYNPAYKDYTVFDKKNSTEFNPDRPTLWPWKLTAIEEGGFRTVWERNPYYYMVDSQGRQLPYIDRIITTYVPNEQIRVLKILAGEVDAQFRVIELRDFALYMQGRKRGGYRVLRWAEGDGASDAFLVNWSPPDPVLRDLFRKPEFRQALSLAVDRDKCNQVVWRGLGTPQQGTVSRQAWHFLSPEGKAVFAAWQRANAAMDIPRANQLLDALGLTRRDSDGYRLRPDGKRLSLLIDLPPQSTSDVDGDEALILQDGWHKLGIEAVLHNWPSAETSLRMHLGKYEIGTFGVSEMDLFTYPDWVFPTSDIYWHSQVGKWYMKGGKEGEAPTGPLKRLLDIYARILKEKDIQKAHRLVLDAVRIHIQEGPFFIGTVGGLPSLVIVKANMRNVPESGRVLGPWAVAGPATSYPETFFYAPRTGMNPRAETTSPPAPSPDRSFLTRRGESSVLRLPSPKEPKRLARRGVGGEVRSAQADFAFQNGVSTPGKH